MDAPVFARMPGRRRHGALWLTREPVCDVLFFGLFLRGDSNGNAVLCHFFTVAGRMRQAQRSQQASSLDSTTKRGRGAFLSSMRCVHIASGLSAASTALGVIGDWPKLTV